MREEEVILAERNFLGRRLGRLGHHLCPLDELEGAQEQMLARLRRSRANGNIEKALRFLAQRGAGAMGFYPTSCHG